MLTEFRKDFSGEWKTTRGHENWVTYEKQGPQGSHLRCVQGGFSLMSVDTLYIYILYNIYIYISTYDEMIYPCIRDLQVWLTLGVWLSLRHQSPLATSEKVANPRTNKAWHQRCGPMCLNSALRFAIAVTSSQQASNATKSFRLWRNGITNYPFSLSVILLGKLQHVAHVKVNQRWTCKSVVSCGLRDTCCLKRKMTGCASLGITCQQFKRTQSLHAQCVIWKLAQYRSV